MADYKELQTRLVNRWDDLEAWNNSTLKLLEGEIALAYVEVKTEKTDPDGKIRYEVCPTYVMKVGAKNKEGELQTFKDLPLLHAPASDVYAWAKLENPTIEQLPGNLKTAFANITTKFGSVTGTSGTAEDGTKTYANVDALVTEMINALNRTDAEATTNGTRPTGTAKAFVTAAVQTNGKIAVTKHYITADDIPTLPEAKVTNLQKLREIVVGDSFPQESSKGPILTRLQDLEAVLAGVSTPMDFLGISTSDPKFQPVSGSSNLVVGSEGAITINGITLTEFQRGDIFAYQSSEYVCVKETSGKAPAEWAFLGDVTATDQELSRLTQRVGTAETNIKDLEKAIYGSENADLPAGNSGNLLSRMGTAEGDIDDLEADVAGIHSDINSDIVRQESNILKMGKRTTGTNPTEAQVILLCCGRSTARAGVDDLTIPSTQG